MAVTMPIAVVLDLVTKSRAVETCGRDALLLVAGQVEAMRARSTARVARLSTKDAVPTLATLVESWAEAEADMQHLATLVEIASDGLGSALGHYVELLSTTALAAAETHGET